MSLVRDKSSTNFNTLSVVFNDNILSLNQRSVYYEQDMLLNHVEVLSGVADTKFSNHSNILVSGDCLDDTIFTYDIVAQQNHSIPVFIAVNAYPTLDSTQSKYLTFQTSSTLSGAYDRSLIFALRSEILDFSYCINEMEILTDDYCRFKHVFENTNYYLVYNPAAPAGYSTKFYYTTGVDYSDLPSVSASTNIDTFQYRLDKDNNLIVLNKYIGNTLYNIGGYVGDNAGLVATVQLSSGPFAFDNTNIFYINYPILDLDLKVNTSWVSYSTNTINQGKINNSKSLFNIAGANLLHSEYNNTENTINLKSIKLKNCLSDKNYSKRSSYMSCISGVEQANLPAPYFREYSSVSTGIGGDSGNDDIALSYVFFDHDIIIKNGEATTFTTPDTLYPYEQININDTTFIRDGAFGNSMPFISDKIYRTDGISSSNNTGSYLTTWLSANNIGDYGVWVDRYYFPDVVSKKDALSAFNNMGPNFSDPIQSLIYNGLSSNYAQVAANPIFDKISDFLIEPSTEYTYVRVDGSQVTDFIKSFKGLVYENFQQYKKSNGAIIEYTDTSINFINDKYVVYDTDIINETGSFSLKFDLTNNWYSNTFNSLFGTMVDRGFSITNDNKITPFTYLHSGSVVQVYNSAQSLIYSLSFPLDVKDVIVGNHLGDYYITYGDVVARVSSCGQIKNTCSNANLTNYINYDLNDKKTLTFLVANNGNIIDLDLSTFNFSTVYSVTPFRQDAVDSTINGIKYINGTCYGFYGNSIKLTNSDYVFHSYNNLALYREQISTRSRSPNSIFCSTSSLIYDFNVDNDDNIVIIHDSGNTITKINKYKSVINTYNISTSGLSPSANYIVDFISEYTLSGYVFAPITISAEDGLISINRFDSDYNLVNSTVTNLSCGSPLSATKIKSLTNYNQFVSDTSINYLNFNLQLKNYYSDTDRFDQTISIPTDDLKDGIQSFVVNFNQTKGDYNVYNNGVLLSSVSFDSNKYRFNSVFKTHFVLGATGFHNNQTLGEFLLQPDYYYVDNVIVADLKIYNVDLEHYKVQTLMLEFAPIDSLNISLPCGQRNNIEEINKVFKFTQPYSNSNNINIVVKNVGNISTDSQEDIKNNILLNVNNTLPADVNINSIKFENYK